MNNAYCIQMPKGLVLQGASRSRSPSPPSGAVIQSTRQQQQTINSDRSLSPPGAYKNIQPYISSRIRNNSPTILQRTTQANIASASILGAQPQLSFGPPQGNQYKQQLMVAQPGNVHNNNNTNNNNHITTIQQNLPQQQSFATAQSNSPPHTQSILVPAQQVKNLNQVQTTTNTTAAQIQQLLAATQNQSSIASISQQTLSPVRTQSNEFKRDSRETIINLVDKIKVLCYELDRIGEINKLLVRENELSNEKYEQMRAKYEDAIKKIADNEGLRERLETEIVDLRVKNNAFKKQNNEKQLENEKMRELFLTKSVAQLNSLSQSPGRAVTAAKTQQQGTVTSTRPSSNQQDQAEELVYLREKLQGLEREVQVLKKQTSQPSLPMRIDPCGSDTDFNKPQHYSPNRKKEVRFGRNDSYVAATDLRVPTGIDEAWQDTDNVKTNNNNNSMCRKKSPTRHASSRHSAYAQLNKENLLMQTGTAPEAQNTSILQQEQQQKQQQQTQSDTLALNTNHTALQQVGTLNEITNASLQNAGLKSNYPTNTTISKNKNLNDFLPSAAPGITQFPLNTQLTDITSENSGLYAVRVNEPVEGSLIVPQNNNLLQNLLSEDKSTLGSLLNTEDNINGSGSGRAMEQASSKTAGASAGQLLKNYSLRSKGANTEKTKTSVLLASQLGHSSSHSSLILQQGLATKRNNGVSVRKIEPDNKFQRAGSLPKREQQVSLTATSTSRERTAASTRSVVPSLALKTQPVK